MPIRSLNGHTPIIHPDAFVSEFAYVVGNVEIGAFSSVWPGSVIRGEQRIVIGQGTCIQDGTVIHCESEGAVIGARNSGGKPFLTRESAYLTGPGEASLNSAAWSGKSRSCSSSASFQRPSRVASWN